MSIISLTCNLIILNQPYFSQFLTRSQGKNNTRLVKFRPIGIENEDLQFDDFMLKSVTMETAKKKQIFHFSSFKILSQRIFKYI